MTATYEQYRERLLRLEESFASFLYLDTRGFLTSGLGYLYVRDAAGATAGASVQARAVQLLGQVGIELTQAQQNTVDGLVWAMHELDAAYAYPPFSKLAAFNASELGQALAPFLKLQTAQTTTKAWTFKVTQAKPRDSTTWLPVQPLFSDPAKHSAYFALFVVPYESTIDRALETHGQLVLTDSQRLGLFSAVWNRPAVADSVAEGLAAGEDFNALRARVAEGRGGALSTRLDEEAGLISGQKTIEDVLGQ